MNVSMDGLRKNIVCAFNDFVTDELLERLTDEEKEKLDKLGRNISISLCVYDDQDKNFRMIDGEIKCKTVIPE